MPNEMTIEAAIIELNRLKTTERMDIDRERLTAAVRVVSAAAKYRIPQKPKPDLSYYSYGECPTCGAVFEDKTTNYCGNCGQVLDWS